MDTIITTTLRGFEVKFKTKPGVFFKTGIDSGTRLLIENMVIEDQTLIADVGCGSGIIGFVASKLNPKGHTHLFDVNLRFVQLAKENAEFNDLRNVEIYLSDLFSAVDKRTYHQIYSNPPLHLGNEFLDEAAKECCEHLKPKGQVIWVIQKHLKPVVERLFQKYFKNCKIVATGKEHVVVKAGKYGS